MNDLRTTHAIDIPGAWATAEGRADVTALTTLLADDFRGIGPHGFVLDRSQWLARFEQPHVIDRLVIEAPEVREHGDTAVIVGVQDQVASYRGNRADGRFRLGLVARRSDGATWEIVNAQLSGPIPDLPTA